MSPRSALVDREEELDTLRRLAAEDGTHLALLYGRRRVGKTHLLRHAWPERPVFHFTASNVSPEQNRRRLIDEIARWTGRDLRPEDYPTWRTVFRLLFGLRQGTRLVLVLDEVQFLAPKRDDLSEVASELNAVYEGDLAREAGLLVVLSGSAVRTLEALTGGGAPLYGRLDWSHELAPFDYFDAGRMVSDYGPEDQIRTYAAFGGTPLYLDRVDTTRPLEENIVDAVLARDGVVRGQMESLIEQEVGLRDVATYRGILASIGQKRLEIGEIAADLGREVGTGLRRMLDQLVELGYLQARRNFEAATNQPYRYRLGDPALRFYHGLVLPNESAIDTAGAEAVWRERLAPRTWPTYVGQHVFEEVVEQAYLRHQGHRDIPIVEEWGQWQGKDRNRRSLELDAVCRLLDGRVLTCSMKFRGEAADATVWTDHVSTLERLRDSGYGWARQALERDAPFLFVSRAGFSDSFREVRRREPRRPVVEWTLDDLW